MTPEKTQEIRVRRMFARQGFTLSKSRRRDPRALDYGRYTISRGTAQFQVDSLDKAEQWALDRNLGALADEVPGGEVTAVKITAEQYGEICDVVERTFHGLPLTDDSGMLHTSREARAAGTRIIEILGLEIQS